MCQQARIHESDVSVWICMFNTDWSVNSSIRISLHPCVCVSTLTVCVCESELIPVCYSDIPGGKEPHDCFRLPDCTYLLMVTSDFIHTQRALRPPPSLSEVSPSCCSHLILHRGIHCLSLFHFIINNSHFHFVRALVWQDEKRSSLISEGIKAASVTVWLQTEKIHFLQKV